MIESVADKMIVLAELFGLGLNEEFYVKDVAFNPYRITERGLLDSEGNKWDLILGGLLSGEEQIIKRPKAPAEQWEPATETCASEREDYEEANDALRHGNALMQQENLELKARLYDLLVERIWDEL